MWLLGVGTDSIFWPDQQRVNQCQGLQWERGSLGWGHPSANLGDVQSQVVVVNLLPLQDAIRMGHIKGAHGHPHLLIEGVGVGVGMGLYGDADGDGECNDGDGVSTVTNWEKINHILTVIHCFGCFIMVSLNTVEYFRFSFSFVGMNKSWLWLSLRLKLTLRLLRFLECNHNNEYINRIILW